MVILKDLVSVSSLLNAASLSLAAGVSLRCETEIAAQQESKRMSVILILKDEFSGDPSQDPPSYHG